MIEILNLAETKSTEAVASNRQTEALATVMFFSFLFKCSHHKHPKYLG